jgi:hypothetical protein
MSQTTFDPFATWFHLLELLGGFQRGKCPCSGIPRQGISDTVKVERMKSLKNTAISLPYAFVSVLTIPGMS